MGENIFKKHGKMMKNIWAKSKKQADSGSLGDMFEDGRYKMGLTDAQAQESQKGDFMVVFTFSFLEGEYVGKNKKAFRVITPDNAEKGLARIILDINKLGMEIEDFEQVESVLEEIRNSRPVVRVTLKTRGEYQDAYIDKILTGEEAENTENTPDESSEEVPSEEAAEETIDVGSKVKFTWKGEDLEGEIKEFYEKDTKVKVKVGTKLYPVKVEDLSLVKEEEEVVEEPTEEEIPEEPSEEPTEESVEEEPKSKKPAKKIIKKTGKSFKKK